MDIRNKLDRLQLRYDELTIALSDPSIFNDQKKYATISKEHNDLKVILGIYEEWKKIGSAAEDTREMIRTESDPELLEMAKAELRELESEFEKTEKNLKVKLVPSDPEDSRNAIIEIRAGTGGDEAAIFVGDLYGMYTRFAAGQGWKQEVLDYSESPKGGFKEISFMLSGTDVFAKMKWESGVHRVQRVPETESQGRVHTSAATVAVLPEADEVDIHINPADLEFEAFRSTGAGGQHINTTDSAVRIRHKPSGIVVGCQEERSQHKNREKAMVMLRAKLYEAEMESRRAERAENRKNQVSTGDRSAKIRTYNFPQGRMTEHRIGLTIYNLDDFIKGNIGSVIEALQVQDNLEKLNEMA